VELGLSYARTDGDYGSPDSLTVFGTQFTFDTFADMAKNAGSAYVEVHFPTVGRFGNGYVRADYYAQSEQYFSNTGESSSPNTRFPSYDLVNVRAGVEDIAGTRLSAHLFVRNVANEEYFVGGISNSSLHGFNMAVPGMPRTYGLSLEYRY
jgi:iron complex outermembrane receptor protein